MPDIDLVRYLLSKTTGDVFELNVKTRKRLRFIAYKANPTVLWIGDYYDKRKIMIDKIGLDIGTKNIVLAFFEDNNEVGYLNEVNGYWNFKNSTPYVRNLLNDSTKKRSDGVVRPARWTELNGMAIMLGKDAEEMAYAQNSTLKRPMSEGGLTGDDEAMTILAVIVHSLLKTAENEIGKFSNAVNLCYCTTADAINGSLNMDYHKKIVGMIIGAYEAPGKIVANSIVESHAVVLAMSDDDTGIGMSFGAGTVTVSYIKFGMEIFSFSYIGSGDWIDTEVAKRHGWSPDSINSKETPTTIANKKHTISLRTMPITDRIATDIYLHYDILISKVVDGLIDGFKKNENKARINSGIPIYIAGGTSMPDGFVEMFNAKLDKIKMPFEVSKVERSNDQLFTVARGCLRASGLYAD